MKTPTEKFHASVIGGALPKEEQVAIRLAVAIDKTRVLADLFPELQTLFDQPSLQYKFGLIAAQIDMMLAELEGTYTILTDAPPRTKERLQ